MPDDDHTATGRPMHLIVQNRRRLAFIAVAAVVLLAPVYAWLFLQPPIGFPEGPEDLARFCSSDDMTFDESPRFDGSGSHEIAYWIDRDDDMYDATNIEPGERGDDQDPSGAALIACGEPRTGDLVDFCDYTGFGSGGLDVESVDLEAYAVEIEFTVYEAATRERVGESAVEPGYEVDRCPALIEGAIARILDEPSDEEIRSSLLEFTEPSGD